MATNYKITLYEDPTADGDVYEAESFGAVLREVFAVVAAVPEQFPVCDLALLLELLEKLASEYGDDDARGTYEVAVHDTMNGTSFSLVAEFPEDAFA